MLPRYGRLLQKFLAVQHTANGYQLLSGEKFASFSALQLPLEELKANYEKEKEKLAEMMPEKPPELSAQGKTSIPDTYGNPLWSSLAIPGHASAKAWQRRACKTSHDGPQQLKFFTVNFQKPQIRSLRKPGTRLRRR